MATQVEVVNPNLTGSEWFGRVISGMFLLAYRILFIWWAVAVWFPEIGLTYWQLVLPVYAARCLLGSDAIRRQASK